MKFTEQSIALLLGKTYLSGKHLMVVPNCTFTGHECDLLCITNDLRIIDFEIKISRADFIADGKKEKWWKREFLGYEPEQQVYNESGKWIATTRNSIYDSQPLEHPIKVWKHYYVLPEAIWKDDMLNKLPSQSSGVLLLTDNYRVRCVKKARPAREYYTLNNKDVIRVARLANWRQWSAIEKFNSLVDKDSQQ